ncbi:hypothetical protein OS493_018429 [Desmophyllum pertusum]|uniref:Uncharacterized protein n=1 Tax=Desmophyllum pertusum TaxID=174260 RepID=A0A9X0A0T3_9CNID|nr:hypothetical protein OS493_018429 [Desmophyllum pertusum]
MYRPIIIISTIIILTLAQDGQRPARIEKIFENPSELDALKRSLERNPFEVWYFKDTFKSLEDMLITTEIYNKEAVERTTTKDRLQNVMKKALLGQHTGVTIMGGSISAGGGLINDYSDLRGIYYRVFIDWWQKTIQPFTGSNIELRNLAVGGTDQNHPSILAHAQMAMMIINSVRDALRRSIESSEQGVHHVPSHDLPRSVYFIDDQGVIPDPLCYTLITPDVTSKFFNPSLSVRDIDNVGFKQVKDVSIGFDRISSGAFNPERSRTDGYGGWEAEKENSILKLQIDLPFGGLLSVNETRAVVIVIRSNGYGGKAEVWLEKYKPGIVVDTYSTLGHTQLKTVAHHVTSGSHVLNIKVVRAGKFTLCGVLARAFWLEPVPS